MTAAAPAPGRPPYERSAPVLSFTVFGLPIPQGSKSFKGMTRDGRAILAESSKYLKPWRTLVANEIRDAIAAATVRPADGFPLLGPVAIDLMFTMRKPKGAPKGRVTWPIVKPDKDKLERAILDAGTNAGLWVDDSQVIDGRTSKAYPLEAPGALRQPGVTAVVYLIGRSIIAPQVGEQTTLEIPL